MPSLLACQQEWFSNLVSWWLSVQERTEFGAPPSLDQPESLELPKSKAPIPEICRTSHLGLQLSGSPCSSGNAHDLLFVTAESEISDLVAQGHPGRAR